MHLCDAKPFFSGICPSVIMLSMSKEIDTAVVGMGAMGSAALYQLAKRGERVLGIDQFSPPHNLGSSHGEFRITRQALGEGEEFVPLALRSYEIWDEIEKATGTKLLFMTGGLILESQDSQVAPHGRFNFLRGTIDTARNYGIRHEVLDSDQIRSRFPQFNITNERGYFEYNAGYLLPELCIDAQLNLAEKYGAEIRRNEKVLEIIPSDSNDKVTIKTEKGVFESGKVILAADPWIAEFVDSEFSPLFKVHRQVLFWYDIDQRQANSYGPNSFPVFVWIFEKSGEFGFYGFPTMDDKTIKIAGEQFNESTTPDNANREVLDDEPKEAYEKFVKNRLVGITSVSRNAETCLYTTTPDSSFVIDFDPKHPQVIIASPCSGHGFKHSPAIGEILAELAIDGKSKIDISKFSIARFQSS